ncbi:outer membrane protein assembly factor BamE [Candidatus Uabimicrobium sp. HlEnr_7]|uniref:outer membrane protein assembly factor BamE domain-containing protein n=1 Tax=Candidatus Uabimicrobium helgolandensis TaxID=3095367 RepID=UPI00355706EA
MIFSFMREKNVQRYLRQYLACVFILSSILCCQSSQKNYLQENPDLDTKKRLAIKTGQVINGMTQKEVELILGKPTFVETRKENQIRWVYRLVEKGKQLAEVYTPESSFPQGIAYIIPFYYRPLEIRIDICDEVVCRVEEILSF